MTEWQTLTLLPFLAFKVRDPYGRSQGIHTTGNSCSKIGI
jgi:hypothetical protein